MRARIVILFAAVSSTAFAQTSPLFINQRDNGMVVVQGGSVIRSWDTVNPGENALAVSDTIRTAQSLIDGHEYDLSGNPLGSSYQIPAVFGRYYDGTTDGVNYNYAMVYNDPEAFGQLHRFDRSWENIEPLDHGGSGFFARAVTFDPATETLWHSSIAIRSGLLWLRNIDLAGNPLDSFTVPGSEAYAAEVTGLAFDPADGTLWVGQFSSSVIRQVDQAGMLLTSFEVPGISEAFGMEFAVPVPSTASFQGLGFLPDGPTLTDVRDISADGTTVVGFNGVHPNGQAFRWTLGTGMEALGTQPGYEASQAYAVSADGSVIVGVSFGQTHEAFRWSNAGGFEGLGVLTWAFGVSPNGSIVTGIGGVWQEGMGWSELPVPPDPIYEDGRTIGRSPSADGSVVAGTVNPPGGGGFVEAVRWTTEGAQPLGFLSGGSSSFVNGMTSDGTTIVGSSYTDGFTLLEAYRWTERSGMISLGDLPGGEVLAAANDVSADGSVIVGLATDELGDVAFLWDAMHGMRSLQDVLVDEYGLNLDGWRLTRARGISDDGLTITGIGINSLGQQEGWIATIPEPPSRDFDRDGDVDLEDFTIFTDCIAGPAVPPAETCPAGVDADLDGDDDVDLIDFGQFQSAFGS